MCSYCTDPLDVIDVDWSSLMPKQATEPRESGAALLKFTPGAVLLRVGISKRLAGPDLFSKVKETCQQAIEKPNGKCFYILTFTIRAHHELLWYDCFV